MRRTTRRFHDGGSAACPWTQPRDEWRLKFATALSDPAGGSHVLRALPLLTPASTRAMTFLNATRLLEIQKRRHEACPDLSFARAYTDARSSNDRH